MALPEHITPEYIQFLSTEKVNLLHDATGHVKSLGTYLNPSVSLSDGIPNVEKIAESINSQTTLYEHACHETKLSRVELLFRILANYLREHIPKNVNELEEFVEFFLNLTVHQGLILPFGYNCTAQSIIADRAAGRFNTDNPTVDASTRNRNTDSSSEDLIRNNSNQRVIFSEEELPAASLIPNLPLSDINSQTSLNTLDAEDEQRVLEEWIRLSQLLTTVLSDHLCELSHLITGEYTSEVLSGSVSHFQLPQGDCDYGIFSSMFSATVNIDSHSKEHLMAYTMFLELLILLHGPSRAWQIYKQTRLKCFEQLIQRYLHSNTVNDKPPVMKDGRSPLSPSSSTTTSNPHTLQNIVNMWRAGFVDRVTIFLQLDCHFVVFFKCVENALDSLLNYYLDCLCDEISIYARAVTQQQVFSESGHTALINQSNSSSGGTTSASPTPRKSGPTLLFGGASSKVGILVTDSPRPSSQQLTARPASADLFAGAGCLCADQNQFLNVCDMIAILCRLESRWLNLINSHWSSPIGVDFDGNSSLKKPKGVLKKTRRGSRRVSSEFSELNTIMETNQPNRTSLSAYPVFEEGPVSVPPYLEWQNEFESLLPHIARSLEYHLTCVGRKVSLASDPTPCPILSYARDVPIQISSTLGNYVNFVERVLPLVLSCFDESTEAVVMSFNHAICVQLQDMLHNLEYLLTIKTVKTLILALCDAHVLQMISFHLANLFQDKHEKMSTYFSDKCKYLSELCQKLANSISLVSVDMLCTSTLHDSEGSHWSENKEFHEGVRCSFTVQAWHAHLSRLWSQMSQSLSHAFTHAIFTRTLCDSLQYLLQRYGAIRPSHRRVDQLKGDILLIITIVESHLGRVCNQLEDWLGFGDDKRLHYTIMSFLQILTIVCSPLQVIYRIHHKGFFRKRDNCAQQKYYCASWLSLIKPDLYSSMDDVKSMNDISILRRSILQLRMFAQCPYFEPARVFEVITFKEAHLSVILLTHLAVVDSTGKRGARDIFSAFLRIFSQINVPDDGVSLVLIPVLDRTNTWNFLDKYSSTSCNSYPAWMKAIIDIILPYTQSVYQALADLAEKRESKVLSIQENVFPDGRLPCGCVVKSAKSRDRTSDGRFVQFLEIISLILMEILALPSPLLQLTVNAQTRCHSNKISPTAGHVVFHLYLRALRFFIEGGHSTLLHNSQGISQGSHNSPSKRVISRQLTAYNKLCQIIEDADEVQTQKKQVIRALEKFNEDSSRTYPPRDEGPLSWRTFNLSCQLDRVLATPKGFTDLSLIYQFLRSNLAWLNAALTEQLRETTETNHSVKKRSVRKECFTKKGDSDSSSNVGSREGEDYRDLHSPYDSKENRHFHRGVSSPRNHKRSLSNQRLSRHKEREDLFNKTDPNSANDTEDNLSVESNSSLHSSPIGRVKESSNREASSSGAKLPRNKNRNKRPSSLGRQSSSEKYGNYSTSPVADPSTRSMFFSEGGSGDEVEQNSQPADYHELFSLSTATSFMPHSPPGFQIRQFESRIPHLQQTISSYSLIGGTATYVSSANFDPFMATLTIDATKLDHTKFINASLDWKALCSMELGTSDLGFRTLLSHRWEFQLDSKLEPNEQEMVAQLSERYHVDMNSL